ncbi:MAG TPA: tetratricopeptide repeat protein, partial [Gemmatimonadaceae bacterium]
MQGTTRIDELKQKFHENPRRYFAPLANEYRKAGDPEQAIAICRAHLAQQPGHMSGHVVYGQALYDAGRIDEARSVFEKALSLDPENVIVLRHLGDIARHAGKSDEARHWYTKALDVDPQDTEIAAYLAELTEPLMASGARASVTPAPVPEAAPQPTEQPVAEEIHAQAEEAVAEPEPSVEKEIPLDVSDVADFAAEMPIEMAGAEQTPASRYTPQSPFVTKTMAELYAQQGHRAAAIEIYRQLAESDPDNEEIQARIAELSARQTPTAEAQAVTPHFTEAEIGEGDTWDTDVWGAGFTAEDSAVAEAFAGPDVESQPKQAAREAQQPVEEPVSAPPIEEPTSAQPSESEVRETPSVAAEQVSEESVGEATADE